MKVSVLLMRFSDSAYRCSSCEFVIVSVLLMRFGKILLKAINEGLRVVSVLLMRFSSRGTMATLHIR